MRFSVRLLLSFLLIGIFSIGLLSIIFLSLLNRRIDEEIDRRLEKGLDTVFHQIDSFKEKAFLQGEFLKERKEIIETLRQPGSRTYLREISNIKAKTDLDILRIIDRRGKSELSYSPGVSWGESQSEEPLFAKALGGSAAVGVVPHNGVGIYIIADTPIRYEGQIIGVLETGYIFDEKLLTELKRLSDIDLTIYKNGIFNTTLIDNQGEYYSRGLPSKAEESFAKGINFEEEIVFADRNYRNRYQNIFENIQFLSPVTTLEEQVSRKKGEGEETTLAILMASLSIDDALASRVRTSRIFLLYALIIAGCALSVSYFISKAITRRLENLASLAQRVAKGDFKVKADEGSKDEFGLLARTFNKMIVDLKTAFAQLEKDSKLLLRRDFDLVLLTQKLDQRNFELKNIVANLEAANKKNEILLGSVGDGVMAVDSKGKIILFNKALSDLTGFSQKEVLNKVFDKVLMMQAEGGARITFSTLENHFTKNKSSLHLKDIFLQDKQGGRIFVYLVISPIEAPLRGPQGFMVIFHDISKERELERMKLDFVSMAAHELRTPITSIRGYLDVYFEEMKDRLNSEQRMLLNRVKISSNRLLALVENLLNVSRIEQGRLSLKIGPLQLEKAIEDVVSELKDEAKEKRLKLEFIKGEERLPLVAADSLGIGEVLTNLLVNAISYTSSGGVLVWSEYDRQSKMVTTHVKDTGHGIPRESLPHLFRKFYRISGVLEQGSKGTGLGLYISKSIIDMHQGKIWAKSEKGKGSTFSFSLPVYAARK